jgi:hypothetical protein
MARVDQQVTDAFDGVLLFAAFGIMGCLALLVLAYLRE